VNCAIFETSPLSTASTVRTRIRKSTRDTFRAGYTDLVNWAGRSCESARKQTEQAANGERTMVGTQTPLVDEARWISAPQLAALLDPPPAVNTIRRWTNDGLNGRRLPFHRRGGRLFYRLRDALEFLAATSAARDPAATVS
jgi:hypothetical protein